VGLLQVRFGDCTETWSPWRHLRRLDDGTAAHGGEDGEEHEDEDDFDDPGPPVLDLCGDPALLRTPPSSATPTTTAPPSAASSNFGDFDEDISLEDDLESLEVEEDDKEDVSYTGHDQRKRRRRKRRRPRFALPPRPPKPRKTARLEPPPPPPQRVLKARKELPYDFDSLTWDAGHQRNRQENYCYCGESGDWYKRMLQCSDCSQWFHQVKKLKS
jgi:hypothetical protein